MPPSLLASSSEDVLPSLLPVAKDLRFSRNAGAKRAFDHDLGIPGSKRQRTRALSPDHASSLDDEENEPSRSNVASAAGVACLNIGGTRFITTLSTLSTVEDSMLAKVRTFSPSSFAKRGSAFPGSLHWRLSRRQCMCLFIGMRGYRKKERVKKKISSEISLDMYIFILRVSRRGGDLGRWMGSHQR